MIKINVTTTATVRPEIIDRTYSSFTSKIKDVDFKASTLYINIDPAPNNEDDIRKVKKIAKKYFGKVVANVSEEPNFSAAINWLWLSAKSKIILHLEDDWVLERDLLLQPLIKKFKKTPHLYQIILRAYKYKYRKCCLSPSLMHSRFYKAVAGNLNPLINPEIQLRGKKFGLVMPPAKNSKNNIFVYPEKASDIIVKDIGRKWIKKTNLRKPDRKGKFTSWVEKG